MAGGVRYGQRVRRRSNGALTWTLGFRPLALFEPLTVAITARIGPAPAVLVAVGVLFGSVKLFDRVFATVDTATLRQRVFSHLKRTRLSFALGVLVTGVTTSVAFSLGVIVPLYNRGYVERDELVPYVLGANIGTLFDTLLVAVVLESTVGAAIVLELLVVATLVTLAALAIHDSYSRAIVTIDERLRTDRRAFVAFTLLLLIVPLALLLVPLALR